MFAWCAVMLLLLVACGAGFRAVACDVFGGLQPIGAPCYGGIGPVSLSLSTCPAILARGVDRNACTLSGA
jgi:hypothetical protein